MTEPIRVLHVFGRLDTGGAESRTMDIYRAIDKEKVQFDFAIHTTDECFYNKEIRSLNGRIYSFPRFNGTNYFQYKKAWKLFFKEHPEYDIVHGHQTNTGFVYLKEAQSNQIPVRIAHSRNSNKENFIKKYLCQMSKLYATHLFAVSGLAGISEFGKKAVIKGRVNILPNAIDAKKYSYNQNIRKEKRIELGLEDEFTICHIGRFHRQKNHIFLINIFKIISEKYKNVKLILVGDGPLRREIEVLIEKKINQGLVVFTGIRADVPELLQAMDILLFPSLYEGLPGVVLEAQASGLPCIISDSITDEVKITELVKYISLKESAEYWANEILKFYNTFERKNTYNEIFEAGYDIENVAKWYESFYINRCS